MSKLTSLFPAATVALGIVAVYLFQQLNAERQLTAQLQARVTDMESQLQAAPVSQTAPRIVAGPPGESPVPALQSAAATVLGEGRVRSGAELLVGAGPARRSSSDHKAADQRFVSADARR